MADSSASAYGSKVFQRETGWADESRSRISRSRCPRNGASTVRQIAEKPAALRVPRGRGSPLCRDSGPTETQRGASDAAAISLRLIVEAVLTTWAIPAAPAARATASSPSGWASALNAQGAVSTGMLRGWPSTVVRVSTRLTSTSTRGRRRTCCQARTFSPTVTSSSAPPA